MRSAKIHSISESEHWADYADSIRREEYAQDDLAAAKGFLIGTFISLPIWAALLYFGAHLIRAIVRWPHWSAILR